VVVGAPPRRDVIDHGGVGGLAVRARGRDRGLDLGCQLGGRHVPAKRRDLDRLRAELHVCQAKPAADDPAVPKELLDLVRMRGRADVEILRPPRQQQVANAPAHQVGDVIVFVKPVKNLQRVGIDVASRDFVLRAGYDGRLRHRREL